MPNVLIPTLRGHMPAFLALPAAPSSEPSTPAPAPGVIVVHDVAGMCPDHRSQAEWLADAGFLALAIDLFYLGGILRCVRSVIRDMTARSGPAFDDIEACRAWLALQPECTGRIGVVGFCMGGGFALLLVSGHGFSASSVNYGGKLPEDIDELLETACPVVGSYGGLARWERGVAAQLARSLDRASIAHDVKEYPDAGHGFMNHPHAFAFKMLRFAGMGYNEAATMDARRRIAAFFHTHLGS